MPIDIFMVIAVLSIPAIFFLGFTMIRMYRIRRAERVAGSGLAVLASFTILTGIVYLTASFAVPLLTLHGLALIGVGVGAIYQYMHSKAYAVG